MIKDKDFYRQVLGIALPIALQNMIGTCAGIVDTIMIGKLGDVAVSGVSLANNPAFFLQMVGFGLATGGTVLISQYWGKGNREVIPRIIALSMRFMLILSILFSAVCLIFPTAVMSIFTNEAAVIAEGANYLSTVAWGYVPAMVVAGYVMSLRGVGKTKFALYASIVSVCVNVFFNYCFIFGNFGFPKLGVVGAAVATVISRLFELLLATFYMYVIDREVNFRWERLFVFDREILKDYAKYSLPVVGNESAWALGALATSAIIGHLGSVAVAANSVANVVQQIAMVGIFGVGNATAVLSGKSIGAGDIKRGRDIGRTMLIIAACVGVLGGGLILCIKDFAVSLYDISPAAKELSGQILFVMAGLLVMSALEITIITGILRGAGDTRFSFFADVCAMWFVGVPMGYLAAFVWGLPAWAVILLMRTDGPVKFLIALPRVLRGKHIRNVTRDDI